MKNLKNKLKKGAILLTTVGTLASPVYAQDVEQNKTQDKKITTSEMLGLADSTRETLKKFEKTYNWQIEDAIAEGDTSKAYKLIDDWKEKSDRVTNMWETVYKKYQEQNKKEVERK